MLSQQATVKKIDVAAGFSRAAKTYDGAAILQRQIGDSLVTYVPKKAYTTAVDVGCGTSYSTQLLFNELSVEKVFGLDLAEGMVHYAQEQQSSSELSFCCGDAEQLPFRVQSVDLLFSNFALQWCPRLSAALDEAYRVLMPGGHYVFSTLGPGTLFELQTAWRAVDEHIHVNHFADGSLIEQLAKRAGFEIQLHRQTVVMTYRHIGELTSELKALGVNNVNAGRPAGLTGKQRFQSLKAHYETFRNPQGLLPATYQVYYVVLEKAS